MRFEIAAGRIKHNIVEVGNFLDQPVNAVGVGDAAADERQLQAFPKDCVRVHVDEQQQVIVDFAAGLLFPKILHPSAQAPGVADVRVGIGRQNGQPFALIFERQRIVCLFVVQKRDQRFERVERHAGIIQAQRLHAELAVGMHLRGCEHDFLRAHDHLALAEQIAQTGALRIADRKVDRRFELVRLHRAERAVGIAHDDVFVAVFLYTPLHAFDDVGRVFRQDAFEGKEVFAVPGRFDRNA